MIDEDENDNKIKPPNCFHCEINVDGLIIKIVLSLCIGDR